jgi:hypothetical protein
VCKQGHFLESGNKIVAETQEAGVETPIAGKKMGVVSVVLLNIFEIALYTKKLLYHNLRPFHYLLCRYNPTLVGARFYIRLHAHKFILHESYVTGGGAKPIMITWRLCCYRVF